MVSAAADHQTPAFISRKLAQALAHPLRVRILVELNTRVMSPSEFVREFPEDSLSKVARHFRLLEDYGCIEEVDRKRGGKRRGGVEHFFRATQRAIFNEAGWTSLPASIRTGFSGGIFQTLTERILQAMEAGTLDAREERHFTWTALLYDQEAWEEMIERIDELFRRSLVLQEEALERMAESGEKPFPATVALACFESPPA